MSTVMIVAGEESGDLLGADLVRALKAKNPELKFIGVGGQAMKDAGVHMVFDVSELSVMGIVEVVPHLPRLFKRADELTDMAHQRQIKALITIDAPDFNLRLAKRLKDQMNIPCVHYVCPSVWAWRPGRAKKIAGFLDHILALFPFEPPYFEKVGLPCTFVGHPVVERLQKYAPNGQKIDKTIALFPGSREGEVKRLLPQLLLTYAHLKGDIPELKAVMPIANKKVRAFIKPHIEGLDIELVEDEEKYERLRTCRAALCKSGTSNLELAMLGLPMVVFYKVAPVTYYIIKMLANVPYISPINWVLGKKAIPEFVQNEVNAKDMAAQLKLLLQDDKAYQNQADLLAKVRGMLAKKAKPAAVAAKAISAAIGK